MDVIDASTSFHYAQAAHKKERFRKLGYVDSANPGTIRQVSMRALLSSCIFTIILNMHLEIQDYC